MMIDFSFLGELPLQVIVFSENMPSFLCKRRIILDLTKGNVTPSTSHQQNFVVVYIFY